MPARPANVIHAVFEAADATATLLAADVLVRVVPFRMTAVPVLRCFGRRFVLCGAPAPSPVNGGRMIRP